MATVPFREAVDWKALQLFDYPQARSGRRHPFAAIARPRRPARTIIFSHCDRSRQHITACVPVPCPQIIKSPMDLGTVKVRARERASASVVGPVPALWSAGRVRRSSDRGELYCRGSSLPHRSHGRCDIHYRHHRHNLLVSRSAVRRARRGLGMRARSAICGGGGVGAWRSL